MFDRGESITLLRRRAPQLTDSEARRVAEALGDLPLALTQAGAHLAATATGVEDLRRSRLGADHLDTLESVHNLAADLWVLGQLKQARQLAEDTLTRRVLGAGHSADTLRSATYLVATCLWALGQCEQGRQHGEDTLAGLPIVDIERPARRDRRRGQRPDRRPPGCAACVAPGGR